MTLLSDIVTSAMQASRMLDFKKGPRAVPAWRCQPRIAAEPASAFW